MSMDRRVTGIVALLLTATGCSPRDAIPIGSGPTPGVSASTTAGITAPPATRSPGGDGGSDPSARVVRVGDLWIDSAEVTIDRMRRFVADTSTRTAAERDGGGFEYVGGWVRRDGWTFLRPYGADTRSDLPAAHLTWDEARSYCTWAGGRLPTAAEWQAAAYTEAREDPPAPLRRGQTYRYPTGDTPERANTRGADDGFETAAPVRQFPPGVNGLYDAGANVWEWLADGRGDDRLIAGGSWWYGPDQMRADAFQYKQATFYAVYVGLRCVYDQPPRQ